MPKRQFSSEVRSLHGYRDKTMMEAWASDTGAYPVMFVIGFAVVFSLGYGTQVMFRHPDARLAKSNRSAIFRGELKGQPDANSA